MKKARTLATALATITALAASAFAQGSLTPPGAPAPTMKTLDQVEPRTPLMAGSPGVTVYPSGTIVISQSGSYYLTTNLTVTSGDGIRISASGVTVNLQGFTIRSTSATSANEGIDIDAGHVSIFNGHIESGIVYNSGSTGDQYTGSGFNHGIYAASSDSTGIRIRDVSVSGCNSYGIYVESDDSLVDSCTVEIIGGTGIKAGIVNNCTASTCGGTAISGYQITDCRGTSTGGDGIYSDGTVADSYGYTTGTATDCEGIYAFRAVQNSYGFSDGGDGIHSMGMVANSYGYTSGTATDCEGIYVAKAVQNSYGFSDGGDGIHSVGMVANSYGYTDGTTTASEGIYAARAVQNSYGSSAGGDGIHSAGTVANSYGKALGSSTASEGIYAVGTVQNSFGYSTGGGGIYSGGMVANSYGKTTGSSEGIYATGSVQNSYGDSYGDGIHSEIVSYSVGFSGGGGDGIVASIATSCIAVGGENIAHKYLMP